MIFVYKSLEILMSYDLEGIRMEISKINYSIFFNPNSYDVTCIKGDNIFFAEIHGRYLLAINSCSGTISFNSLDQKDSRK